MIACIELSACTKCGDLIGPEGFNTRKGRGVPYRQCRVCMASRKWAAKNPERHRASTRQWVNANRERARSIWRDMSRKARERDPSRRIHGRISNQVWSVLKRSKNCRSAFELVGYSFDELKAHIERQFLPGMGWHNMGQWHIDHITPLASFTISGADDPELKRAWSLPNLRPLWAKDNIRKGAKMETLL